jgi:hypothetical protein
MEFKLDWVQIQSKGNEIQIGTKDIKNMLVTLKLKKKTLKKLRSKKHVFISLYLGSKKHILAWELSKGYRMKSKVVLHKLVLMNHLGTIQRMPYET